jgi:CarboxypepD_reg-like domain/Secretion system C-terminal sorting domain/von Willebrand factor type A domain
MKRLLFTLIAFLSVTATVFSQSAAEIILMGKVFDIRGEPLPFATVMFKNTKIGTQTNIDGQFRLELKAKDTATIVVVMLVGMERKELKINEFIRSKTEKNVFSKDILLSEDTKTLSEVVVVGYGTSDKKEVSSSVAKMKSADMTRMPTKSAKSKTIVIPTAPAKITREVIRTKSAPSTVETTDRMAMKTTPVVFYESAAAPSAVVVTDESRETHRRDKLYDYENKTTEKRDVLKDNKALMTFAEDLIAIPEASDFLKEIEKARANAQEKAKAATLNEDDDIETEPSAGKLTAGEWSDLKNWEFWKKSLDETFKVYVNNWRMNFTQRHSLILRGANNQPVSDATVQLIGTDGLAIWTAKTDNSGRAELFADAFGKTNAAKMSVLYAGKTYNLDKIRKVETGANELKIPVACSFAPTVDIAFVVDATGSMGDEIAYLKAEVADVIRQVKRDNQQLNVRLGSVFYRDFNDAYLTRTFDFDKSLKKNVEFIREQSADGGGDTPEAVPEGLEAAIDSMTWSNNAVARLLFLVLDAPPHLTDKNIEKLQRLSAKAAEKGIRIIPIAASGVDQNTEYLMKALAVATGGTYTFLTDDSGVGGEHLKATTEKHEVELLNALMIRLIKQYSTYEACNDIATEATTGGNTKLGLNFKVYPNPVRDVMNLELKTAVTNVFITNAQGQKVRNLGTYTEGSPSVDVSDLPSGIYFVHFEKDGVVCTKKISVVK